jgi:hypothetical protein
MTKSTDRAHDHFRSSSRAGSGIHSLYSLYNTNLR